MNLISNDILVICAFQTLFRPKLMSGKRSSNHWPDWRCVLTQVGSIISSCSRLSAVCMKHLEPRFIRQHDLFPNTQLSNPCWGFLLLRAVRKGPWALLSHTEVITFRGYFSISVIKVFSNLMHLCTSVVLYWSCHFVLLDYWLVADSHSFPGDRPDFINTLTTLVIEHKTNAVVSLLWELIIISGSKAYLQKQITFTYCHRK